MRVLCFFAACLVSGCADIADRAINGQTAVSKLRAELGADIDLRLALQKDMARKNAQLEYVSDRGYPCGPATAEFQSNLKIVEHPLAGKKLDERKEKRIKFLTAKYVDLGIVLAYGGALDAILKGQSESEKAAENFQKFVDAYASYVPSEVKFVPGLVKTAGRLYAIGNEYRFKAQMLDLAVRNEPLLIHARQEIIRKGVAKKLTETEDRAFKDWDTCARDRLFFVREFDPQSPPKYLTPQERIMRHTRGETRSPVLSFMAEYNKYLDEREAFIGLKPDYMALIDAVVNANTKIAHLDKDASMADFVAALTTLGTDAANARDEYETFRTTLRAEGVRW